jgi:thiamine-monophosphate kinase
MSGGEFDLIAWMRRNSTSSGVVRVGIGDDCAVLAPGLSDGLLVTTDMLMDGRHFRLGEHDPADVARKALLVNVSDIAAMAGVPLAAFVAVALPLDAPGGPARLGRELHAALAEAAAEHSIALAGGDTNAWHGPLVITVTLLGRASPLGPVLRRGARPGDVVLVTGPLGGSLLGRHLRPTPRVTDAAVIHHAAKHHLHALIDVSDGLAADLGHILAESGGLGATLDADAIPIHADAVALGARDGRTPLDHALHDGEDFELCLAVDPACLEELTHPTRSVRVTRIGTIDAEPGLRLRHANGRVEPIEPRGFDHFREPTGPTP